MMLYLESATALTLLDLLLGGTGTAVAGAARIDRNRMEPSGGDQPDDAAFAWARAGKLSKPLSSWSNRSTAILR